MSRALNPPPTSERVAVQPSFPRRGKSSHGPRRSRSKIARALLVAIFFMLRVPDVLVFRQTYNPVFPSPALRGNLLVIGIWTTLFLAAVWFRHRWARYLLIAFAGYIAMIDGVVLVSAAMEQQGFLPASAVAITLQFISYAAAVTILVRSSAIRRLVDKSGVPSAMNSVI
jgi:hypothetical protein